MILFHIVILALIQGITEFLPVSSSGHLVLAHQALGSQGWENDLTMDVAVHVGTLFAIIAYFYRDFLRMARTPDKTDKNVLIFVIIGSLPLIVAGYGLHVWQPEWLRSIPVIGGSFVFFGILLWLADHYRPNEKKLENLNWRGALFIGFAQILALIPGTSRSGITITAARYLGFNRVDATRFSLFLALIAISGAGTLGGLELIKSGNSALGLDALIAAIIAFFASWAAIAFLMRWLEKASFTPFVIYRIAFGAILLGLYYSGTL